MFFEKMLLSISTLLMLAGGFLWFWRSPVQFPQETTALNERLIAKFENELQGTLVFDSRRTESFGIYTQKISETEPTVVVDSELHEMYPDPSPDGSQIVLAQQKTLARDGYSEIWIVNTDGSNLRKIAENGTFPTFSSDGQTVYFERGRRKVIAYSLADSSEIEVFPAKHTSWSKFMVVKPRVSTDGKFVYFTTDRSGKWNAYYANIETGESGHIGRGCEPVPFKDADNKAAWISKSHVLSKSGVGVFDRTSNTRGKLHDSGPPYGHEYFPTIVKSDRFLLYAACPGSQHDHLSANYQIFVRDLKSNDVARITHDTFTNRWPKLILAK